jgi:hypothetical protein
MSMTLVTPWEVELFKLGKSSRHAETLSEKTEEVRWRMHSDSTKVLLLVPSQQKSSWAFSPREKNANSDLLISYIKVLEALRSLHQHANCSLSAHRFWRLCPLQRPSRIWKDAPQLSHLACPASCHPRVDVLRKRHPRSSKSFRASDVQRRYP